MTVGPLVAARRAAADAADRRRTPSYSTDVLPAVVVFGLGLSRDWSRR